MTKKINYFDLGLHAGLELRDMVFKVFPELNLKNCRYYGFEASKQFADYNKEFFKNVDDVEIINKAIADKHGEKLKLYHVNPKIQPNQVTDDIIFPPPGMSIFRTKNNVTDEFEEVDSIIFSKWLKENVPSYKEDLNIMKVNIEGAEYHLFKDMVNNDILKYFPIMIGAGHDVDKVSELDSDEYWKIVKENNIDIKRYCTNWKPHRNVDVKSLITSFI